MKAASAKWALSNQSLVNPIAIEFKCLVEYNGWFRRIIRVKDVKGVSKTKEFKGKIDYSIRIQTR